MKKRFSNIQDYNQVSFSKNGKYNTINLKSYTDTSQTA